MRDDENTAFFKSSTVFSAFETTKDFLVVACETCENDLGFVRLYYPDTMRFFNGVIGKQGNLNVGSSIAVKENIDGANQVWYTSRRSEVLVINTFMAFQNRTTDLWRFQTLEDQFSFVGADTLDSAEIGCFENSCFYKSNFRSSLSTFEACDFGEYLDNQYTLEGRFCKKCASETPFSYGLAEEACATCESLYEVMLISPELDRYAYDVMCAGFLDPVVEEEVIEETDPIDENPQVPEDGETPVTDPTGDEETDGTLIDGEEVDENGSIVTPEEDDTQG